MMVGEYLSLHEKRRSSLLADEDDRDFFAVSVHVEQHSILAEKPQFALAEAIRS